MSDENLENENLTTNEKILRTLESIDKKLEPKMLEGHMDIRERIKAQLRKGTGIKPCNEDEIWLQNFRARAKKSREFLKKIGHL